MRGLPIPVPGKLIPGYAIPPRIVERPIGEVGKLRDHVEDGLPDQVPRELSPHG